MDEGTFAELASVLPEPTLLVDGAGRVLGANGPACALLQRPLAALRGLRLAELGPGPSPSLASFLSAASRSRSLVPGALALLLADGTPVELRCDGAVLRPRAGDAPALILVRLRPRTDAAARFLLLGEKVELLGREVRRRVAVERRLVEQTEELRRSNEELRQFAYAASHDLQEPLRMVSTYTQLLERRFRESLGDEARPLLERVVEGAQRMRALIADLLELARLDTDPQEPAAVDLAAALRRAREALSEAFESSGAVLEAGSLPAVPGVESHLARLFEHLLANAIKFRREEAPRIRVEAEREGDEWRVTVADDGIGLDPRYAERIFALFQRLHSRDAYPGTGIGLTTARKIVERHGGRIWVESTPGQGARFHFTLPARRRAVRRDDPQARPALPA